MNLPIRCVSAGAANGVVLVALSPIRPLRLVSQFLAIDLMAYAKYLVLQRIRKCRDDVEIAV